MEIMSVDPQMLGEPLYPLGQQGNLDLYGTRILLVGLELLDDLPLPFLGYHFNSPNYIIA